MSTDVILQVEGLEASYGASRVLFGMRLEVRAGEVVSLMGRNGMGKSTTINAILGVVPPTAGRIVFLGREMRGKPVHRIARAGIGIVPEGRQVFSTLTVRENLIATASNTADDAEGWTLERVFGLFPLLAARRDYLGARLSGGEQQMLAIGRALMTNPKLLILDEATEGLAPLIRREIWTVLGELKRRGLALIVVDKDLHALARLADRHYVVQKGSVAWEGTSEALLRDFDQVVGYVGL
jgi:branched-chain amino acid transport system ATP-binding protein